MCALKSSLLKTVLVLSKWMCCSIVIAWSARPVWCLWWVDRAECQTHFCIADAMCCKVLRVSVVFAGYAWILEFRRDVMRCTDHRHRLSVYVGMKIQIFFAAGIQFIVKSMLGSSGSLFSFWSCHSSDFCNYFDYLQARHPLTCLHSNSCLYLHCVGTVLLNSTLQEGLSPRYLWSWDPCYATAACSTLSSFV